MSPAKGQGLFGDSAPFPLTAFIFQACTDSQFAFICSTGVAFVPLEPPTLRQLSFLAVQKQHCKIIDGIWRGGISEEKIRHRCSCSTTRQLL